MSDMTLCFGEGCLLKENCLRYKAEVNNFWQSYFCEIPVQGRGEYCEFYIEVKEED